MGAKPEKLTRIALGEDIIKAIEQIPLSVQAKNNVIKVVKRYAGIPEPGNYICSPGGVFAIDSNKTLTAICASGLGNRICTLIGGLYWANQLNYNFQIYWDIDPCCSCNYKNLFSSYISLLIAKNNFVSKFASNILNQAGVYPEHHVDNVKNIFLNHPHNYEDLNKKLSNHSTIYYNSESIPEYINNTEITNLLSTFKINSDVATKVKEFIVKNNISKETIGVHIRKIDPPEIATGRFFIPIEHYINLFEQNKDQKYFVCSDNQEIETICKQFSNVSIYSKKYYAKYIEDKDVTLRDEESVIEGFIDMLILSRTNILPLSYALSSFCKSASYFANVEI